MEFFEIFIFALGDLTVFDIFLLLSHLFGLSVNKQILHSLSLS